VFAIYTMGALTSGAYVAALAVGVACGLALAAGVSERTASPRRVAAPLGIAAAIVAIVAVPLRGITDVRPEIARIVEVEARTSGEYRAAADRVARGMLSNEALVQTIEGAIVPELQAAGARLKALSGVPQEQRQLIADADEYVRLRCESWRLRAEGLRRNDRLARRGSDGSDPAASAGRRLRAESTYRANLAVLGKAEGAERASLEALARIKPGSQP